MVDSCLQTPRLHIFGGTSDALSLCRLLETHGVSYTLSVATDVGEELAGTLKGDIIVGRMDERQMTRWLKDNGVDCVIDATHPFAAEVSRNVLQACQSLAISCFRFERPQHIDALDHPLLFKVDGVEQACIKAAQLGERIFLTTGSKQLADYVRLLPGKFLLARVLPTVAVLEACNALGLGVANIIALKGPFSAEINAAMYRFYQPDVVITKESGEAGGYRQKVQPCIDAGIPCIVIRRPQVDYLCVYSNLDALVEQLLTLRNSEEK